MYECMIWNARHMAVSACSVSQGHDIYIFQFKQEATVTLPSARFICAQATIFWNKNALPLMAVGTLSTGILTKSKWTVNIVLRCLERNTDIEQLTGFHQVIEQLTGFNQTSRRDHSRWANDLSDSLTARRQSSGLSPHKTTPVLWRDRQMLKHVINRSSD